MTDGIKIRRARHLDTAAMLDITRDVWEGHDYLPSIWSRWLEDTSGVVLVAEVDGQMAGFQHVDVHPDNSAWLEGIRVREDAQNQGVGSRLVEAGLEWARFSNLTVARLATASSNPASNRICSRAGMQLVRTFVPIKSRARHLERPGGARPARPDELAAVQKSLGDGTCFYTEGWTAYLLTEHRLRLLLATGQVMIAGEGDPSAVAIVTATAERRDPRVGLLRGTPEGARQVMATIWDRAAQRGEEWVRGLVELRESDATSFRALDFERAWEHDMLLWQIALS